MARDWFDLLSRPAAPDAGYGVALLKDGGGPAGFSAPVALGRPEVNERDMAVTCVLTTPTPDRQGDIVEPAGGDFSDHRDNPVVLFHHGKGAANLPVGKAEDKNGNYTVRLVQAPDGTDALLGTTYFSQKNRFANDVFDLIAEDILRGVSVGFDPVDDSDRGGGGRRTKSVEILGDSPTLDRPAVRFNHWKLLEYSHTPLGVNREALTVAVSKAMDGSRKIHPALLKSLTPYAAPRKAVAVSGYQPRVSKAMPDTETDDEGLYPASDDADTAAATADDEAPADNDADDRGGEGAAAPPAGVQTLLDASQGLMDLCEQLENAVGQSDSIEIRKFAAKACADARGLAGKIKGYAEKHHAKLQGADEDYAEGEEPEESPEGEEGSDAGGAEPPETDDEGAIVAKGLDYAPKRWTFRDAELAQIAAPVRKAKPTPADDADDRPTAEDIRRLLAANEQLRADLDAARNASRRRG